MPGFDPSNIIGLWNLVNSGINYTFPPFGEGTELFTIFFFAFIIYILLRTGADRISCAFVVTFMAGAFAYTGVSQSPVIWGVILLGGGFLTASGIRSLLSD